MMLAQTLVVKKVCTATRRFIDLVQRRMATFSADNTSRLEAPYCRVYDDAQAICHEIEQVATILKDTADR